MHLKLKDLSTFVWLKANLTRCEPSQLKSSSDTGALKASLRTVSSERDLWKKERTEPGLLLPFTTTLKEETEKAIIPM